MKTLEVPDAITAQTYPHADPDTILVHQLPDPAPPAAQMMEEITALVHSLTYLHPAQVDELLERTARDWTGPLASIRRIALLLRAEQERAPHFVRPAYFYADEK